MLRWMSMVFALLRGVPVLPLETPQHFKAGLCISAKIGGVLSQRVRPLYVGERHVLRKIALCKDLWHVT